VYKNQNAWERVLAKGFGPFFRLFDDILFAYSPEHNELLWKGETRDQLFRRIIDKVLERKSTTNLRQLKDISTTSTI
jgi:hypothetical protein